MHDQPNFRSVSESRVVQGRKSRVRTILRKSRGEPIRKIADLLNRELRIYNLDNSRRITEISLKRYIEVFITIVKVVINIVTFRDRESIVEASLRD